MATTRTETPENKAFRLRDRIGEKLKLISGDRRPGAHPDVGLHYVIGLHVPEWVIEEALRSLNDAHMNDMAGRRSLKDPAAYFTACVREICNEAGEHPPINWKGSD